MKITRTNDIKILSEIEHVLKRPQMYVGSTTPEYFPVYVYEQDKIVLKNLLQVPALIKLFDEIISNSVDEAIRTNFKYATKIKVTYDNGVISVEDNGRGLPIELDKENKWTPEVIFTQLRAGSNFNDNDETKGQVVGQFGVGGSLVPIFSKTFEVESANGMKHYKQLFENSMSIKHKPKIKDSNDNFTLITFEPNYDYFNISEEAKKQLPTLIEKRVKDLAFAYPEITFYWNKEKINTSSLKKFLHSIHEVYEYSELSDARLGIFYSDTDFQQISFVNGAETYEGGSHVDYVVNGIVEHLRGFLKKKHKVEVKPIDIKSKLFLILSLRMNAPQFSSQVKSKLITTPSNGFKQTLDSLLTKKFLDSICKNEEIILPIVEAYKLKQQVKDNIELKKLNQQKKKVRIEKYYPATKEQKYLLLTEGDAANGSLMAILGRDRYSYFALKGKPLNTLEADVSKIKSNEEIKNIISILNLRLDVDKQDDLTHEKIIFATDADLDGRNIQGLLLCLFERFAPSLLKNKQIGFLRTPMVIAKKKDKVIKSFYFFQEYQEFSKNTNENYEYDYKKGLGSWKKEELRDIISKEGIDKFIIEFEVEELYNEYIKNWMSSKTVDYRKEKVRSVQFDISGV